MTTGVEVAHAIADVVAQLDAAIGSPAGAAGPDAPAVGVGAPGMLDREGRLRFAPNLPQAHGVNWTVLIGERLPGPPDRRSRTTPTSPCWPSTGWVRPGATGTW